MIMLRNAALLCVAIFLTACGYGTKDQFASKAQMEQYTYASKEAPSLTLIAMINNRTGAGGHTSILINGNQTVMYDPAGRWRHSQAPERHDVVYGVRRHSTINATFS